MKDKIKIPGPARAMYGIYLGTLAVILYTGFYFLHPFASGSRYPWTMSIMRTVNMYMGWIMVLTALVYLYYATIGKPRDWKEPLGLFRIFIALLSMWFFLVLVAAYQPYSWMRGLMHALGGPYGTYYVYGIMLWVMLLVNVIYIYARWTKSERFPRLRAAKEAPGGDSS